MSLGHDRPPVDVAIVGAGLAGLTAARWNGYFEGAVRSGEDAAAAVLSQL